MKAKHRPIGEPVQPSGLRNLILVARKHPPFRAQVSHFWTSLLKVKSLTP